MSFLEIILRTTAIVILAGYLLLKHRQRVKNWRPAPRDLTPWPDKPSDAAKVMPRIDRLRQDYVAEVHPVPHDISHRKYLLAEARRVFGRLPFFSHDGKEQNEMHGHSG